MKKLNELNLGKSLNREEMRTITGGIIYPGGDCMSDCSTTGENTCASPSCPNSYCATYHCGPRDVRIYSCQYQ